MLPSYNTNVLHLGRYIEHGPIPPMPSDPYPQLYRLSGRTGTLAACAISPNPGGLLVPIVTLLGDLGFGNTSDRTGMSRVPSAIDLVVLGRLLSRKTATRIGSSAPPREQEVQLMREQTYLEEVSGIATS